MAETCKPNYDSPWASPSNIFADSPAVCREVFWSLRGHLTNEYYRSKNKCFETFGKLTRRELMADDIRDDDTSEELMKGEAAISSKSERIFKEMQYVYQYEFQDTKLC
jgi:hypothetical protein